MPAAVAPLVVNAEEERPNMRLRWVNEEELSCSWWDGVWWGSVGLENQDQHLWKADWADKERAHVVARLLSLPTLAADSTWKGNVVSTKSSIVELKIIRSPCSGLVLLITTEELDMGLLSSTAQAPSQRFGL